MIVAIALMLATASLASNTADRPVAITEVNVIAMDRERVVADE